MQRPFSSFLAESEVTPVSFSANNGAADIFFDVPDGSLELSGSWPEDTYANDFDLDPLRNRGGSSSWSGGAAPERVERIRFSSEDKPVHRWAASTVPESTLRHVPGGWDRVEGMDPQHDLPHRDSIPLRLPRDAGPPLFHGLDHEAELGFRDERAEA